MVKFNVTFTSTEHFYNVIRILNEDHYGLWKFRGKVLRQLKIMKTVEREVTLMVEECNISPRVIELILRES